MDQNIFYAVDEKGKRYPFEQLEMGGSLMLTLKKEIIQRVKKLWILPELSRAEIGEEGYYILPRNPRIEAEIQTFFRPREDGAFTYTRPIMSWYGIKKADFCCVVRVDRNYIYQYEIKVEEGVYTACPLFDFRVHDPVYDDIRVEVIFLPKEAGYNEMARTERETRIKRGEIRTLREKCALPAVEYARKHPLIRIRMGWKASPSPVLHQTEANEPEMLVACDFARVRDIADELKRQGVEGAELQLVGWNRSGHDGRFPQLFPADPRLGGDEGFHQTVEYVKALGYRISTHTNTLDSYTIADTFNWGDVCIDRDGGYDQIGHFSGGLAYRVCMERQWAYTQRDLPRLAAFGEDGLHFTDVISIIVPEDCHSPAHPSSTANSILYAQRIMEYTRGLFGGFSSEGCMDFALRDLDFGLYVTFGGRGEVPFADRYLPVWELVYHGITLYNPIATTVNFTAQPPKDRLKLLMYGGKPAMYYYSRFKTKAGEQGLQGWMGENDLTCENQEALERSVGYIKEAEEVYRPFADLQFSFMKSYEFLENGLQKATYENGAVVYGNFSDETVSYEGITLEPWGYRIENNC